MKKKLFIGILAGMLTYAGAASAEIYPFDTDRAFPQSEAGAFAAPAVDIRGTDSFIPETRRHQVYGFMYAGASSEIYEPGKAGSPVPEPTTMLLFGTGLAGLAAVGRRRKK